MKKLNKRKKIEKNITPQLVIDLQRDKVYSEMPII